MTRKLITSESVTEGHPDKMADQISDAILDEILIKDPNARVACETLITMGLVLVAGEITTKCYIDIPRVVRDTIRSIGYTRAKYGFDCDTCSVITSINEQSADIAMGVNKAIDIKTDLVNDLNFDNLGAGDQGMMFGYATNENDKMIPFPIAIAHDLTRKLSEVRKNMELAYLRPDGKAQVTIEYNEEKPVRVDTVVISTQHHPDVPLEQIREDIIEKVITPVIPDNLMYDGIRYLINPTGRFVIGGPQGDTGLTGRKIIVDTYGGLAHHGGGAFSGKDPSKVDRSASYAARYVAKNIVAAGLADRCEVQLAYAIGVANPVSITVETFNTGKIPGELLIKLIREYFDLRPSGIIKTLDLCRPIYKQTASYGHFGRNDIHLPWEQIDIAKYLKEAI